MQHAATHYELQRSSLAFLCLALAEEEGCFVIGSGASHPEIPVTSRLADRLRPLIKQVGGFPAAVLPPSPFNRFLQLTRRSDSLLDHFKLTRLTGPTLAVAIEQTLRPSQYLHLAQYSVFELFPHTASLVVFNWDPHPAAQCPQGQIIYPHGQSQARRLGEAELDEVLFYTQDDERSDGRDWLTAPLVLPGDENGAATTAARRVVLRQWLTCSTIIGIGYGFGLNSWYDRVWRDLFVLAIKGNPVPVHIVDPNAAELVAELSDRAERQVEMYSWPFLWRPFARALLTLTRRHGVQTVAELALHAPELLREYDRMLARE